MPDVNKPSDVKSKKIHRFTKRRLIKTLSAAGFTTSTAKILATDDFKAAASDQVPISLTFEGDSKVMVPADWYDRLHKARNQWKGISNRWLNSGRENGKNDKYNDVHSVWLDAGARGTEPKVIVSIDKDSETKDETRGRLPEHSNGIEIEIEEVPKETQSTTHSDENRHILEPCGPHDCEHQPKNDTSEIPGGLMVTFKGSEATTTGTLCPRTYDTLPSPNRLYCLMTAAHVPAMAEDACADELIGMTAWHNDEPIGEIVEIDHNYDYAIIWDSDNPNRPQPEVWNPESHDESYHIKHTMNEDGVDYFINNSDNDDVYVQKFGVGSCHSQGNVAARGNTERNDFQFYNVGPCSDFWHETVRWGEFCDMYPADSGSLAFGQDPTGDDYWGVCINSWRWYNYSAGPAGYALLNHFSKYWSD